MAVGDVRASVELELEPAAAFDVFLRELADGLSRLGLRLQSGAGGRVLERDAVAGRVVAWEEGRLLRLEWASPPWRPGAPAELELKVEPVAGGCRVVVEQRRWTPLLGDATEQGAWFASEIVARLLATMAPRALGDWETDRAARRPAGVRARGIYGQPVYHIPNFRVILQELALEPSDYLLEVGCGGGVLLKEALKSRCRAAAVDHSPDMVRLARETNREAVEAGRLEVLESSADRLPFPDATFTCAAMTGVLGFLADPVEAFAEMRRVLADGGRVVALGADPELRGTPAAPEPMASRLRFYAEPELEALGRAAGFSHVRVVRRPLAEFARGVVPDEHMPLFEGPGPSFLLARK